MKNIQCKHIYDNIVVLSLRIDINHDFTYLKKSWDMNDKEINLLL